MMNQIINTKLDEVEKLEIMVEILNSIIDEKDKIIKELQEKLNKIKDILE